MFAVVLLWFFYSAMLNSTWLRRFLAVVEQQILVLFFFGSYAKIQMATISPVKQSLFLGLGNSKYSTKIVSNAITTSHTIKLGPN
jgi:hypothetical protein